MDIPGNSLRIKFIFVLLLILAVTGLQWLFWQIPASRAWIFLCISVAFLLITGLIFALTQRQNFRKIKNAGLLLAESEQKYRMLTETLHEGASITNLAGEFQYVNKNFAEMLGYGVNDLLNSNINRFTHAVQIPALNSDSNDLKDVKKHQDTMCFTRKDECIIRTHFNSVPFFDSKGNHTGTLSTYIDITEQKKLAEEMTQREQFYDRMISNLPHSSVFVLDTEYRLIQCGGSQLEKIGLNRHLIKGKSITEIIPPEVNCMLEPAYQMALNGEEASCEINYEELYMMSFFVPLRNTDGLIEHILVLTMDITSQKKTENNLRLAQKKLNLALENADIGVWEWDLKTDKMVWDSRMEKIFSIEPGAMDSSNMTFENLINEEDLPHFREAVNKTLKMDLPFETVFRTKPINGCSKFISTKALVNKYRKGKSVGLTGVCFDVTSMKKGTEKVLFDLNEELMRSNKDLQQFAYVASHDLQEPLRMVSSFTQMLEQRYQDKLDDDGKEFIKYAVDGSKRMYFLLNGLLAYSRVQSKAKEFERVKMSDVLEKVKRNLSLKIQEKGAVISYKKLPVIFADESQMIQLVQNLVENGLKFSKEKPLISVSARSNNEFHVFSVKDGGIGIENQYFEKIFKIFQRLHRKEDYEGTGIGLAICKRIVERHSGSIWVESEPGKGSSFMFTIPRYKFTANH